MEQQWTAEWAALPRSTVEQWEKAVADRARARALQALDTDVQTAAQDEHAVLPPDEKKLGVLARICSTSFPVAPERVEDFMRRRTRRLGVHKLGKELRAALKLFVEDPGEGGRMASPMRGTRRGGATTFTPDSARAHSRRRPLGRSSSSRSSSIFLARRRIASRPSWSGAAWARGPRRRGARSSFCGPALAKGTQCQFGYAASQRSCSWPVL